LVIYVPKVSGLESKFLNDSRLKMGFKFSLNETIVETAILELGNNSYLIFMIFPKFTILNLFLGKIILGIKILIIKCMIYIIEIMEYYLK
jgi:hypothetical protein